MSTVTTLLDAIKQLSPDGITTHEGEAPPNAKAPWLVIGVQLPEPIQTMTGSMVAGTFVLTVTITALTEWQCQVLGQKVYSAFLGACPEASGWSVGALQFADAVGPYPAGLTAEDTDRKYRVAKVRFLCTCSELD